jgi:serine phosphatase RsbU (regulator of sigma subunit)
VDADHSRPLGGGDEEPSLWPAHATLPTILDDIRQRMSSGTASVLLVDNARLRLEPTATVGLERTTRGAPSIPIGKGFAGRVAQTRQPVIIDEVTSENVINPVLLGHGVRSLLGVPITVGSELLGVLHVGQFRPNAFDEDQAIQLTELANELGVVLQRRFIDDSHVAALALQRSLLPTAFRLPAGIDIAARYVPAEGDLGGDWYDAFQLPDGRFALVIGDVVGHGLESAIIMGRLRSALRAYALEHTDPAEVLQHLDQKICHFEPDRLATVLLGFAPPPYTTWTFSSAGHFAPVVATPGAPPAPADLPIDPLLGAAPQTPRRSTAIQVPGGGLVCLYTDGLVERRPGVFDAGHDVVGEKIDALCTALDESEDPESACIRVLTEVVGEHIAEDDIAVLIARLDAAGIVDGDGE